MEEFKGGNILVQDDSCHWYLVPYDKKEEFNKYLDDIETCWELFEDLFGEYRLGGGPGNVLILKFEMI